ncbi:MAG: DHHA1 domain-containing protein, partial [Ghiorsea sp.]
GEEAMALLCCSNGEEASKLAKGLDDLNIERRKVEADTFKQACSQLGNVEKSTPLVLYDESWHAGVVGLVAGRLARQHGRPAAVGFIEGSGEIRVSLRGVRGFHIGNLLHACSEHLIGFGGHAGAGGGTIKHGAWKKFVEQFQEQVERQRGEITLQASLLIDGVLSIEATHFGLASRLQKFEPIGQGNPACIWVLRDVMVTDIQKLRGGVCRLTLTDGAHFIQGVAFKAGMLIEGLVVGESVSFVGQLKMDDFRGGQAIQFIVEDMLEA